MSIRDRDKRQEMRDHARMRVRVYLNRMGCLPVRDVPALADAEVDQIAARVAMWPVEVFNAIMDRADVYGSEPMGQIAAALDFVDATLGSRTP